MDTQTVDLLSPVKNEQVRSVHFFNGRLLTSEDLTEEQLAHRNVHELLGNALGDGIVRGLTVLESKDSTAEHPVLTVSEGVAISRHGDLLVLPAETSVRLAPAAKKKKSSVVMPEGFAPCTPPPQTAELLDAGLYLLTITSAEACEGKTPFGGFNTLPAPCNMRYIVDAVQFRLIGVDVDSTWLLNPELLQNRAAYACFGWEARAQYAASPFGAGSPSQTLLEMLGSAYTECDVPLALLQWGGKDDKHLKFVDMWAVRRMCSRGSLAFGDLAASDRATAIGHAMRMQFNDQMDRLIQTAVDAKDDPTKLVASDRFEWLPPAGLLRIKSGDQNAVNYETFFSGCTYNPPVFIEGGDVEALLNDAIHYPPIHLAPPSVPERGPEMIWLYFVRENRQTLNHGGAGIRRQYVVFANANLPYYGESRFDRSHFNYSNFV